MKNTKKFAAMIAALTLSACSVAPMFSFAEDDVVAPATTNFTMTAPSLPTNATIDNIRAIKIFDASISDSTFNITGWATGITSEVLSAIEEKLPTGELKTAISAADATANSVAVKLNNSNATDFAKAVAQVFNDSNVTGLTTINATSYAEGKVTFGSTLGVGYYLVLCDAYGEGYVAPTEGDAENGVEANDGVPYSAVSLGMLTVTGRNGDVEIGLGKAKVGLPTVQKKVKENSDTNIVGLDAPDNETDAHYNDIADWNIGDDVPFKLYGTLPSDYDTYNEYYYCFTDTLGKEFTFDSNSVVVKANGETITADDTTYSVTTSTNSETKATVIKIEFNNLKNVISKLTEDSTDVITVEYNATLNANAVVGTPGQNNAVKLTYSNNPNNGGKGETGDTPDDKVRVYTYAVEIDKTFVNAAGDSLTEEEIVNGTYSGAKFTLSKPKVGEDGEIEKDAEGNTVYETITVTKVTAEDTENYGTWDYIVDDTSSITELTLTDLDVNKDDSTGEDGKPTNKSDNKLVIRIKGLDEGTYLLTETESPTGFNKAPAQTIKITAETGNTQTWNMESDTLTSFKWTVDDGTEQGGANNVSDATALANVINKQGTELPSTGGMGTTLFYLGGGAMVAVAGVFLITKKRMGKSEN